MCICYEVTFKNMKQKKTDKRNALKKGKSEEIDFNKQLMNWLI